MQKNFDLRFLLALVTIAGTYALATIVVLSDPNNVPDWVVALVSSTSAAVISYYFGYKNGNGTTTTTGPGTTTTTTVR